MSKTQEMGDAQPYAALLRGCTPFAKVHLTGEGVSGTAEFFCLPIGMAVQTKLCGASSCQTGHMTVERQRRYALPLFHGENSTVLTSRFAPEDIMGRTVTLRMGEAVARGTVYPA